MTFATIFTTESQCVHQNMKKDTQDETVFLRDAFFTIVSFEVRLIWNHFKNSHFQYAIHLI